MLKERLCLAHIFETLNLHAGRWQALTPETDNGKVREASSQPRQRVRSMIQYNQRRLTRSVCIFRTLGLCRCAMLNIASLTEVTERGCSSTLQAKYSAAHAMTCSGMRK